MLTVEAKRINKARIVASLMAAIFAFTVAAPHVFPALKSFEYGYVMVILGFLRMTATVGFFISLWFVERAEDGAKNT